MPALQLDEVSISFGARRVLDDVHFRIGRGDKVALAGANGSGKTTLMRILVGQLPPDSGQVARERDTRVSYLPQSGVVHRGRTLLEEAEEAFGWARELVAEQARLEEELGRVTEQSEGARRLLERHHEVQERLADSGWHRRRERIEQVLTGLGFRRTDLEAPAETFSGGWQMRIALARVLLEEPDILLLDEPTNYLDLEARTWLEDFLVRFRGGVLVVSHDRYFLDATVKVVAELYLGGLGLYPGNYTQYETRRQQELAELGERWRRQQEEIERIEAFVRRFRYNASKATLVQSRIRQLERIEPIEVPPTLKRVHFSFPAAPRSGRQVLRLEGVSKSYAVPAREAASGPASSGTIPVISGLDLELEAGDRLVLAGPNGAGKSTLMRILSGEEAPDSGRVVYGHNVSIGYYAQDHADRLEGSASVEETVTGWAPTHLVPQVRNLLGAFLFRGEEVEKPVAVLSGGEKSRLAVLRLLLRPANLLFLDEPTNHMDLASKDVLLEALQAFTGTLVFVSHDRHFIEGLAGKVLELEPGGQGGAAGALPSRVRLYLGDYPYYLWRKQQEAAAEEAAAGQADEAPKTGLPTPGGPQRRAPSAAQAHEAVKRLKSSLRRLEREEEAVMARIEGLQEEAAGLQEAMGREEVYTDGQEMRRIKQRLAENEREQEELHARWEELDRERRELSDGEADPGAPSR